MEKQYIGARYVPKFFENSSTGDSTWAEGTAYEPLTIVTWNGNSYTSKKAVPSNIGSPNSNPIYWASTGLYNEQINQLINDVNEYKEIVDALKDDVVLSVFPKMQSVGGTSGVGSCQYFTFENHAFIIDLGIYDSYSGIKSSLQANGIDTIDGIILTHWHGDHTGTNYTDDYSKSYDHWKNDFNLANTVFYVTPDSTAWSGTEKDRLIASFPDNQIVTVNTSDYNILWHELCFRIFNTTPADYIYYDQNSTDYNDYSMIVYIENGYTRLINTGDVGSIAQERIYDTGYCLPSIFGTAPHHAVNTNDSSNFALMLGCVSVYASSSTLGLDTGYPCKMLLMAINKFANEESRADVNVSITKNGVITNGTKINVTSMDFTNDIYFDPTASYSAYQDGSESHPYRYLKRAISACSGLSTIHVLGDSNETVIITKDNGFINFIGNNHSVGNITVYNDSVILDHLTISSLTCTYGSFVRCINCSFTSTIQCILGSTLVLNSPVAVGDINLVNATGGSRLFIADPSLLSRGAEHSMITGEDCIASGYFDGAKVGSSGHLFAAIRSIYSFGRDSAPTASLGMFYTPNAAPTVMYDTQNRKLVHMTGENTFVGVAVN